MATKKSQRIAIWIIAIVMTVGTMGAYFIAILQTNNESRQQQQLQDQMADQQQAKLKEDPTAYKVDGDVTKLKIEDLKPGTGGAVKASDTVKVHYKGTIAQSGLKFESSYDTGEPLVIKIDQLITGWKEGLVGLKEGGKRRLIIPSDKAYGDQASGQIPPNSDLVFEIELLELNPPEQQ